MSTEPMVPRKAWLESFYRKLWERTYRDAAGVVRYESNEAAPPEEVCQAWAELGLPVDLALQAEAREADLVAVVADYREARATWTPEARAEHAWELRAAFGPGVEVVDILTGERTLT